jgi:hypothetical protein
MTRFTDTFLQAGQGPATGQLNPTILDPRKGGMNGWSPDYAEWASAQAYIQKNVNAYLIEAPRGFDYLPNKDAWVGALKALIELHPQSITGLNSTYEVEVAENAVGGAGQMFEDFTNVTEARTQVSMTWIEKYGMPIGNFFRTWIRMLMMNPNTKYADIMTLASGAPTDQLADLYSATVLFVEPDPTGRFPINAWLTTNFWPRGSGEITGKRDLTSPSESRTIDIQFAGLTQQGTGVLTFAKKILDSVSLANASPNNRPAFVQDLSADVQTMKAGLKSNIENLGATAVQV